MKRFLFILLLTVFAFGVKVNAQQKPVIMVIPDKDWCIKMGYTDINGQVDYEKARLNDEVRNVCTEMGSIMSDMGYPLQDFAASLDELKNEKAMDMVAQAKDDGEIVEDDYDKLMRIATCDYAVNISFTQVKTGFAPHYEYIVKCIDTATSKQKSGFTGVSSTSKVSATLLLQEAVDSYMDKFASDIQRAFDDAQSNGREGSVTFKIADTCPLNFESDVTLNGDTGTLAEVLDYWIGENAIDDSYSKGGQSRVRCEFKQVRFPLKGEAGKFGSKKQKSLDMNSFLTSKGLDRFLSQFGISCSYKPIGIGKCYVILGGL